MGIRIEFLIKHVRPHGVDSMETILCKGEFKKALLNYGVAQTDIDTALITWAVRADLEFNNESKGLFVEMAKHISLARWSELYNTNKSTILFLDGPLMKELGYQSEMNKGKEFAFAPHEGIPFAVTISKDGSYEVHKNVKGVKVMSDENGNCFHLGGLVE
jgi:hypothetical protein